VRVKEREKGVEDSNIPFNYFFIYRNLWVIKKYISSNRSMSNTIVQKGKRKEVTLERRNVV